MEIFPGGVTLGLSGVGESSPSKPSAGQSYKKRRGSHCEVFKGERREDGGWRDSSTNEQSRLGTGGFQESQCLSFVILGEAGWELPPALGLLGIDFACCSVYCQRSSGCFFRPFSKDGGWVRQRQGPWTIAQTPTSVTPEIQAKLKAPLARGCLTDWEAPGLGSGTKLSQTQLCSSLAVRPWTSL